MYKKCAFEKPPSLKTRAAHHDGGTNVSEISTSREFFLLGGEAGGGDEQAQDGGSEPVPPEELMRAYR